MKKVILFAIPMSICNFRCHYCYLSQRDVHIKGIQPLMKYSPEQVARAMSIERIGGPTLMNFCADGETLLTKDLDKYIYLLVKEGHYAEIVTNLSYNPMLDSILAWDKELLAKVEFKCSFHYLELKRLGLLQRFSDNVHKIWEAGASANIELTPSDELIPFIEELKTFCMAQFGALPQLTIARNDKTSSIDYLTSLSMEEYDRIWGQFDSNFWRFKKELFGVKRKEFCYAGAWSLYIDLTTGQCKQCYIGQALGDAFAHPEKPLPSLPIGCCRLPHCYNGHALLSCGLIPNLNTPGYGDLRDRSCADGGHWLQPDLREFFDTKLVDSNKPISGLSQFIYKNLYRPGRMLRKIKKRLHFK